MSEQTSLNKTITQLSQKTVHGRNPAPVEVGRLPHYFTSQVVSRISEPSTVSCNILMIPSVAKPHPGYFRPRHADSGDSEGNPRRCRSSPAM